MVKVRHYKSKGYNWSFDAETGAFARWGATFNDDPQWSPVGPELLDIEVSTVCARACPWCYKSNGAAGKNMSYFDFASIIDKMPKNLCQVAIGIGDPDGNPDLEQMFMYCRSKGIIPNITISGHKFEEKHAKMFAKYVGAVSVSHYTDDECFNAVKLLKDAGVAQVNIHQLVCREILAEVSHMVACIKSDDRLKGLNAMILLAGKKKGRGISITPLTIEQWSEIIHELLDSGVPFGGDSCCAHHMLAAMPAGNTIAKMSIEPCESTMFSSYINVEGRFFPCSFNETGEGLDVIHCKSFLQDIWMHPDTVQFRQKLLACERHCPVFKI